MVKSIKEISSYDWKIPKLRNGYIRHDSNSYTGLWEHEAEKYCKNKAKANKLMNLPALIDTKPQLACAKHQYSRQFFKNDKVSK